MTRSLGFSEKPPTRDDEDEAGMEARDQNLALIEDLSIGPYDHKSPFDDPHFMKLEPNSGIHFS